MTKGKSERRLSPRRGGISAAWAIIMLGERQELRCWVLDESKTGVGLESTVQLPRCPVELGSTLWMLLKPSTARKASWVAATIKHAREKGKSGIWRFGIRLATTPPASLGEGPPVV